MHTKTIGLMPILAALALLPACSTAPPHESTVQPMAHADEPIAHADEPPAIWQTEMLGSLNFRDFTDPSMLIGLTEAQIKALLVQATKAYEEERRWFIFMAGPSDDAIVPPQSPLRDLPWDRAITDEIRSTHMAIFSKIGILRALGAMNTSGSLLVESEIVSAARTFDNIVKTRRRLSRDILERVYSMNQHVTTFYDFDLLDPRP